MSRTSRRISRPLIAALAVVVVLFAVFTINKVRKAHAQVATTAPKTAANAPITPAAVPAHTVTVTPKADPATASQATAPAIAVSHTDSSDDGALVTQTPTEKVNASDTDKPTASDTEKATTSGTEKTSDSDPVRPDATTTTVIPAATAPQSTVSDLSPTNDSSNENDAAGLQAWAKGSSKTTNATPPAHVDMPLLSTADAKTKLEAGDLISARQILNDNLIAGHGDAETLKKQIEEINMNVIFSARKFPDDPWGGSYQVAGGERLGSIAARNNITWEFLSRINGVTPKKLRSGQWIKIAKGPFFAVVTKHAFKMDLYLGAPGGPGSMFVRTFMVGLGKDNSTPTGLWSCKAGDKIRNPRYYPPRGGDVIAPDDPKNPLGGYWIAIEGLDGQALGKESYGIHGTIDPDSIGKMASMGCIRLRATDISWVFDLLVDGKSKVLVKD